MAKTEVDKLALAPEYDSDTLRAVTDFDSAVALVEQTFGGVAAVDEEIGDGFAVLDTKDKGRLVGVPFVFVKWEFHDGEQGEFVSAHIVTKDGAKYILNDGSTGIYSQLWEYTQRNQRQGALFARTGLRKSEYQKEVNGEVINATTYYLDTSKP